MGSINFKFKDGSIPYNTYDATKIPDSGRFNPYSYIQASNYRKNRRGKLEYEHDLAELQYMAQLRQQDYERDYTSESASALRQRLAGINPDLNGVDAGSAGSAPTIADNPMADMETNGQVASRGVSSVMSVISTVASLASSAMGVASGLSGLQGSSLGNLDSALGVADKAFTIFDKWSAGDPEGMNEFVNLIPTLNRRQRKHIERMYNQWSGSPYMGKSSTKFQTDVMEATGEFYRRSVDPKYNSPEVSGYIEAWKPLVDALNEQAEKEAKGAIKKAEYDSGYYSEGLGQEKATRERNENSLFSTIRKPLLSVLNNFEEMQNNAPKGSREYDVALYSRAFLSGMILKMFSGM